MKGIKTVIALLVVLQFFLVSCEKQKKTDPTALSTEDRYFNLEKVGWKSRSYTQQVDDIAFTATAVPIQYYILKSEGNQDLDKVDIASATSFVGLIIGLFIGHIIHI